MKNILKITLLLLLASYSFVSTAQEVVKKKEITFNVSGKCDMCKTRIENALDIKGVKYATWDVETHICKVIFDPRKVSEDQVHQAIAKVGHDTEKVRATDEAYNNLHGCCFYERQPITEE